MSALKISAERCKGCLLCVKACAKGALKPSGNLNKAGYDYISVDDEKCIACGLCYQVCPDNVFELD